VVDEVDGGYPVAVAFFLPVVVFDALQPSS
jgi:hypothetical protein